jgi:4-hydroxy-3-polyprenylbenzoate decarboxylase
MADPGPRPAGEPGGPRRRSAGRRSAGRRIIIAITGATGAIYGVRLLQRLAATPGVETHLVISDAASLTLQQEVGLQRRDVEALAHVVHRNREIGATIASGSFQTDGMVIAPCSMKTLAAVAHGLSEMGGIVFPPLPSFYNRPATIDEMVDHTVARVMDLLGVANDLAPRWAGLKADAP